jgi:muramoyltetrapeptide carboxypeptidase
MFDAAAGLVFGRPYGYTADDASLLWDVVAARTESSGLPVLVNVELGHADPMVTLPLGVGAELDAGGRSLRLAAAPTVG